MNKTKGTGKGKEEEEEVQRWISRSSLIDVPISGGDYTRYRIEPNLPKFSNKL